MILLYVPIKPDDCERLELESPRRWREQMILRCGVGIAVSDTTARARYLTAFGPEPAIKVIRGIRIRKNYHGVWQMDVKFGDLTQTSLIVRKGIFRKGDARELARFCNQYDYDDAVALI